MQTINHHNNGNAYRIATMDMTPIEVQNIHWSFLVMLQSQSVYATFFRWTIGSEIQQVLSQKLQEVFQVFPQPLVADNKRRFDDPPHHHDHSRIRFSRAVIAHVWPTRAIPRASKRR